LQRTPYEPAPAPHTASRRAFLATASGVLVTLIGAFLAVPLVGTLLGPAFRRVQRHFARVAPVAGLPLHQPVELSFRDRERDAFLIEDVTRQVWAVRHTAEDVTVFSPICPHLGCRYRWVSGRRHFHCPCHDSVFAVDGRVLSGPAPRPLDTLPIEIRDGELRVKWERFEPGIPQKKAV
jgi:menaquinol-cytochrome c reductase iron-sulfur subunit